MFDAEEREMVVIAALFMLGNLVGLNVQIVQKFIESNILKGVLGMWRHFGCV